MAECTKLDCPCHFQKDKELTLDEIYTLEANHPPLIGNRSGGRPRPAPKIAPETVTLQMDLQTAAKIGLFKWLRDIGYAHTIPAPNTPEFQRALAFFMDYFIRNYPGPDTVIFDPRWHGPKLFAIAESALRSTRIDKNTLRDRITAALVRAGHMDIDAEEMSVIVDTVMESWT